MHVRVDRGRGRAIGFYGPVGEAWMLNDCMGEDGRGVAGCGSPRSARVMLAVDIEGHINRRT